MNSIKYIGVLILAAVMTGCASVPMASLEQDTKAKQFVVKRNKSNIYIYRNETFGAAVTLQVDLDGKPIGKTAANTYLAVEVKPGKHRIVSHGENEESLVLNAKAGRNHFVWQEIKMGVFSAGSKLHLVDGKTGRAGVNECKLIDMNNTQKK